MGIKNYTSWVPPMYLKKRKAQTQASSSEISQQTKSWKGRVLVRNPTVKKAQASTKEVVWFSSTPAEDLAMYFVELTGKIRCQDTLRARQCLNFELHYKLQYPFPPSVKLLVFAALYKCDSGEEVKEGVINNYAYVHCSTCHGVAVFQKLYLDTRSQVPHFLEFTLWVERENASNPVDCYGRETFYPVPGDNTYRTSSFIPHVPFSSKNSQTSTETEDVSASENKIDLLKMVPNRGVSGETTYVTFQWLSAKEANGEIFVVWNDEIIHVPYYSKGANERILIVDKIPECAIATVPVYLQERPPQDSKAAGVRSNTLFFHYSRADETVTDEFDSQRMKSSTAGNDASSAEPSTPSLKRPYAFPTNERNEVHLVVTGVEHMVIPGESSTHSHGRHRHHHHRHHRSHPQEQSFQQSYELGHAQPPQQLPQFQHHHAPQEVLFPSANPFGLTQIQAMPTPAYHDPMLSRTPDLGYLSQYNSTYFPSNFITSNWSSEGLEGGSATITESLSLNDSLDGHAFEWVPSMDVIEDLFEADFLP